MFSKHKNKLLCLSSLRYTSVETFNSGNYLFRAGTKFNTGNKVLLFFKLVTKQQQHFLSPQNGTPKFFHIFFYKKRKHQTH